MTIEAGDFVSIHDCTCSIHQGLLLLSIACKLTLLKSMVNPADSIHAPAYLQVKFPVGMTTFVVMEPTRKFFNLA